MGSILRLALDWLGFKITDEQNRWFFHTSAGMLLIKIRKHSQTDFSDYYHPFEYIIWNVFFSSFFLWKYLQFLSLIWIDFFSRVEEVDSEQTESLIGINNSYTWRILLNHNCDWLFISTNCFSLWNFISVCFTINCDSLRDCVIICNSIHWCIAFWSIPKDQILFKNLISEV